MCPATDSKSTHKGLILMSPGENEPAPGTWKPQNPITPPDCISELQLKLRFCSWNQEDAFGSGDDSLWLLDGDCQPSWKTASHTLMSQDPWDHDTDGTEKFD